MPKTKQSVKQRGSTAGIGFGDSSSSPKKSSGFDALVEKLRGTKISRPKLREEVFNQLYDGATENPEIGKSYFFEYDPKFKDQLKEWDEYPLIRLLEKKGQRLLGANLHYLNTRARLGAINKEEVPTSTLHYYLPKNADNIFFEVPEDDIQVLSQFPVEKFHRNR